MGRFDLFILSVLFLFCVLGEQIVYVGSPERMCNFQLALQDNPALIDILDGHFLYRELSKYVEHYRDIDLLQLGYNASDLDKCFTIQVSQHINSPGIGQWFMFIQFLNTSKHQIGPEISNGNITNKMTVNQSEVLDTITIQKNTYPSGVRYLRVYDAGNNIYAYGLEVNIEIDSPLPPVISSYCSPPSLSNNNFACSSPLLQTWDNLICSNSSCNVSRQWTACCPGYTQINGYTILPTSSCNLLIVQMSLNGNDGILRIGNTTWQIYNCTEPSFWVEEASHIALTLYRTPYNYDFVFGGKISGLYTNGTSPVNWRCTSNYEEGWDNEIFNDYCWSIPSVKNISISQCDKNLTIMTGIDWLYLNESISIMYCRWSPFPRQPINCTFPCNNSCSYWEVCSTNNRVQYCDHNDSYTVKFYGMTDNILHSVTIGNTTLSGLLQWDYDEWKDLDTYWFTGGRHIAIIGQNVGYFAGIWGGVIDLNGYTIPTNGSWKCSNSFVEGWEKESFDDSTWNDAFVVADSSLPNIYPVVVTDISPYLIWSSNPPNNPNPLNPIEMAYCRLWFGNVLCNASYSEWSPWSPCRPLNPSCIGIQTRNRTQIVFSGTPCGSANQNNTCTMPPVDCTWSWSEWSNCSELCGSGFQMRQKNISLIESCGGSTCGPPLNDTRTCNTQLCEWGNWSEWSNCSQSCGGGFQMRIQESCGGSSCGPPLNETRPCNTQLCCELPGNFLCLTSFTSNNSLVITQGAILNQGNFSIGDLVVNVGKTLFVISSNVFIQRNVTIVGDLNLDRDSTMNITGSLIINGGTLIVDLSTHNSPIQVSQCVIFNGTLQLSPLDQEDQQKLLKDNNLELLVIQSSCFIDKSLSLITANDTECVSSSPKISESSLSVMFTYSHCNPDDSICGWCTYVYVVVGVVFLISIIIGVTVVVYKIEKDKRDVNLLKSKMKLSE